MNGTDSSIIPFKLQLKGQSAEDTGSNTPTIHPHSGMVHTWGPPVAQSERRAIDMVEGLPLRLVAG